MLTKEQQAEFESFAKPLMEWLKGNGDSGTVMMTCDNCHLLNPQITIERRFNFYDDPNKCIEELALRIRSCDNCLAGYNGKCKMQSECNEKNGFPLFKELPF